MTLLNRSRAKTVSLKPLPRATQAGGLKLLTALSFHCATRLAATPPALVNSPPATTWNVLTPAREVTNDLSAWTGALAPEPRGERYRPFHEAMLLAATSSRSD